jgi:hypothetical protein
MTDRGVEAISDFLRHFGSFGCRQIRVRRTEPKPRTPDDVGPAVGRGRTRMPARAWPPVDGCTAPTRIAPRGSDWAPAGA